MAEGDKPNDGLDNNFRDVLVSVGKGAAGVIPFASGAVAEALNLIPGQRADRIVAYLRALDARVAMLSREVKENNITSNPEKIDLIEEGGVQAGRATSNERLDQIVEAVSRGLTEDDTDVVRRKRLLLTFAELDDDEVSLLNAYGRSYGAGDRNAFQKINRPDPPTMGSPRSLLDQNALFDAGKDHLIRLGLLRKNYSNPPRGQAPEFDVRSGDFKHNVEISPLGRMLLREIGLETPFDVQQRA